VHPVRLVPLLRTTDAFEARVLTARLGSEGILTQLRGGIDSPYPGGVVDVMVCEDDLELARQLLLADEVEAAFDDLPLAARSSRLGPWMVALVVLGVVLFAYVHTIGYAR
jgi:hypothetical protein